MDKSTIALKIQAYLNERGWPYHRVDSDATDRHRGDSILA